MSNQFQTSAEVMIKTANHVDDVNHDVDGSIRTLRGIVQGTSACWHGEAQSAFMGLMTRFDESAARLGNALTAIAENIRANAGQFAAAEDQNVASLNRVAGAGLDL